MAQARHVIPRHSTEWHLSVLPACLTCLQKQYTGSLGSTLGSMALARPCTLTHHSQPARPSRQHVRLIIIQQPHAFP